MRRILHSSSAQKLLALKPSTRERAHYGSNHSRPGSSWLGALLVTRQLHLSDQVFYCSAHLRTGIRAIATTY